MPNEVFSKAFNRKVALKLFGVHVLQFEKTSPDNGWIKWDGRLISVEQLVDILNFDVDPDSLNPLDLRIHHKKRPQPLLENLRH